MYDEARQTLLESLSDAPFAGVPFLIKDLVASYKGVRMTSEQKIYNTLYLIMTVNW